MLRDTDREVDWEWLIDWLKEVDVLWETNKLFELEADMLLASELLALTPFSSDLLFPCFDKSVWVLSDTDPTICDLVSTEVCAAYTRSLGKIAIPVVPVPKIAANAASSLI